MPIINSLEAVSSSFGFGKIDLDFKTLALLVVAAFLAGWIDAVIGGGGLIQLPALLLIPGISPVQALATNKLASVFGTSVSSVTFYRKLKPDLSVALPMATVALIGAIVGASVAVILPSKVFLPIIVIALLLVLLVTVFKPRLGMSHKQVFQGTALRIVSALIGLVIGFYDGLLGPGTGTFLVIALVGIAGFSFLNASAYAKIVNFATNIGALILFVPHGVVLWQLGLTMAACNMIGSFFGSRTAIARGSKFVRIVFIFVASALLLKLGYDLFSSFSMFV